MKILSHLQAKIAALVGNIWVSRKMIAIWPWPATVIGAYDSMTTGNDYRLFASMLQPGDMILTTQAKYKGSNSAIPGAFKHLMVYTGPIEGELRGREIHNPRSLGVDHKVDLDKFVPGKFNNSITHAESEGIGTFDLLDIFSHYDYMCVIRAWKTPEEQKIIVETALKQNGKPYDFEFNSQGIDSLYCTEVGSFCLQKAGIETPETVNTMTQFWKPWKKTPVYIADAFVERYPIVCKTVSCNDESIFIGTFGDRIKTKVLSALGKKELTRGFRKKTIADRFATVRDAKTKV